MGSPGHQELRDSRTVEIAFSLLVGVVVCAVPPIGVLSAGRLLELSGAAWEVVRHSTPIVAPTLGAGTAVWLLVRARRRGL